MSHKTKKQAKTQTKAKTKQKYKAKAKHKTQITTNNNNKRERKKQPKEPTTNKIMPSTKKLNINTTKPVLVTGATGYVAGVLIKQLLEKGLTVHGTVRDPTKTERIQYLQKIADASPGKIKFFKGDLLSPGSFDDAMAGCQVVFHTASPFVPTVKDPQRDLVDPALLGTENVLGSVNKTPTVKRVVLTSSIVSTYGDACESTPDRQLTEEVWNRTASLTNNAYSLSKTLAEQKAWTIAGSQTRWSMCTIMPALVIGPGTKYHGTSTSFSLVQNLGNGDSSTAMGAPPLTFGTVDVRDVATAHIVAAFAEDEVDGGRYIVTNEILKYSEMGQAIGKVYSSKGYKIVQSALPWFFKYFMWLVAPYAGLTRSYVANNFGYPMYIDNTKSIKELGMEYIPAEQSLQEMFQQLIDNEVVVVKK